VSRIREGRKEKGVLDLTTLCVWLRPIAEASDSARPSARSRAPLRLAIIPTAPLTACTATPAQATSSVRISGPAARQRLLGSISVQRHTCGCLAPECFLARLLASPFARPVVRLWLAARARVGPAAAQGPASLDRPAPVRHRDRHPAQADPPFLGARRTGRNTSASCCGRSWLGSDGAVGPK